MVSTDKEHIVYLAKIAAAKGLKHIIISPGSRSAPLVIAFSRQEGIKTYTIVDERCAAFVALGMAQQTNELVGLICTSGSAVLNYAPAISEAYYQKIPLIVMTADRPNEAIDQGENQSINQFEIYKNYIKKSFEMPLDAYDQRDLWYSVRIMNEAINTANSIQKGPVHINIPLREPLYELKEYTSFPAPKIIESIESEFQINDKNWQSIIDEWKQTKKKLIILGTNKPSAALKSILKKIEVRDDIVVFNENTSNQNSEDFIQNIDAIIEYISAHQNEHYIPELVVTIGGGLISKKLKFFLKNIKTLKHWHISVLGEHWDNFQSLTKIIPLTPENLFDKLLEENKSCTSDYHHHFNSLKNHIQSLNNVFFENIPYSDFSVFKSILQNLPNEAILFLGNSTPIRYSNLIPIEVNMNTQVYANRGVSGIDGVVSTSAGASMIQPDKLQICIVGDIGFFYDSNAWWNPYLKSNFKCVLINNQGGNIFKIIPGPDSLDELETCFETKHQMNAKNIAQQYEIDYFYIDTLENFSNVWREFIKTTSDRPALLEIKTPNNSDEVLRNYFEMLRNCL